MTRSAPVPRGSRWTVTAAPVSFDAAPAALSTFSSARVRSPSLRRVAGSMPLAPISPITPARTPVSPIPSVSSATKCAASSSCEAAATSGGCVAST